MDIKASNRPPHGGSFLVEEPSAEFILTPEKLGAECRMMAEAARDFLRGAVTPVTERLEAHESGLMPDLLRQAATLGLLGIDVPEAYGGLGLRKSVSARIAEALAPEPSFAVSHNVHTSVATLPILFFGTPDQKQRYLPRLASGELIGAYALSESHAGSDAMAARTRAVPAKDGKTYALTGEKMWITNAAFADLFTVFAKVDDKLTAFLVERGFSGVSIGREEHKLGLKGSSTCRLILDNVPVPAENMLGAVGEGGKVALYTLNMGRFKIAASSVGQSKNLLGIATRYAKERKAFGKPIAEFGLIREKLATMAARIFAAESMLYRVAGYLDAAFEGIDPAAPDANARYQAAAEEYAIECALIKVACTETLDYVADETLQIHGGYGYTEEYPAARAWRDARVNRIYEGTNEINRLNIVQLLMRRIEKGRINFPSSPESASFHSLGEGTRVSGLEEQRTVLQRTLATALQTLPNVGQQQEICRGLGDMVIGSFAWETACVRSAEIDLTRPGENTITLAGCAQYLTFGDVDTCFRDNAAMVLGACGDRGWEVWPVIVDWLDQWPDKSIATRQFIATAVIHADGYPWS